MKQAVIFDMNGVLIDSESFWHEVTYDVYKKFSVPVENEDMHDTIGFKLEEAIQYWHNKYQWENFDVQKTKEKMTNRMIELVKADGTACNGVYSAIELLLKNNFTLGVASGSSATLVDAVLQKLNIKQYIAVAYSADTEPYGKPHPGTYLSAAKKLQCSPKDCIAVEDSPNGALSANRAGMKCILVPDQIAITDKRFENITPDLILNSLSELTCNHLKNL
ncbi:MAG: 2-deoxyglucose-6-phosphatase [Candidatus Buchananbacteria bacterium CG10_big_fil_rev_8_21_14_0_10_42_9]|uniref:2-deoxyglucose-6-phosphatase n=1 Tax=Candidatus Buchananbacteria bacterium CG10_big_fil_rev_8_21_14_0_10_42_9 TaxID=1974526 RepID=A0A2H0W063_9BACT|nr:MAG: 2-deoxyglucose-6-phosphatase [Candidatus Buchananbacteria bacterium CG10_big_fil_rev_8_21_14_0_10_42_9]